MAIEGVERVNGRYGIYNLDCVILFITPARCIRLVTENRLRGNSSKNEPDDRLYQNLDGQTAFEQPEIGNPRMGPQKRDESGRVCQDHYVFPQNEQTAPYRGSPPNPKR